MYRAHPALCRSCSIRSHCTSKKSSSYKRVVRVPITPYADTEPLQAALKEAATRRRQRGQLIRRTNATSDDPKSQPAKKKQAQEADTHRRRSPLLRSISVEVREALVATMIAVLLPAVLRHTFRHACRQVHARVKVTQSPPSPPPITYYASTTAQRQHRRLSWDQRRHWNQLDGDARVSTTVVAPSSLVVMIQPRSPENST